MKQATWLNEETGQNGVIDDALVFTQLFRCFSIWKLFWSSSWSLPVVLSSVSTRLRW